MVLGSRISLLTGRSSVGIVTASRYIVMQCCYVLDVNGGLTCIVISSVVSSIMGRATARSPGPERWERRVHRRRWVDWPGGPVRRLRPARADGARCPALPDPRRPGRRPQARLQGHQATGGASRGRVAPSPGTVYPTLQLLDDQGFVRAEQAAERHVYALTEAGGAELAAHAELVATTLGRFGGRARPRADPHEVSFLRDELHDLTRTVGAGLRAAMASGDMAMLRRMRHALERCQEEIRRHHHRRR